MRYSQRDIGGRIRQVRGARTQEEFAKLHATSQGYVSDLEHGKALPSFNFLLSLVSKEGLSLDWLVSAAGSPMYLSPDDEAVALVREKAPQVYRKVDELLLVNPNLSPALLEFLDLFFKLEKQK